jgi:hypothetical protein
MRPLGKGFVYAACCAMALGLPVGILAQNTLPADRQEVASNRVAPSATSVPEPAFSELPDSPGTTLARAGDAAAQQESSSQSAAPPASQPGTSPESDAQDQTQKTPRPVGTAAAEAPKVSGVTAAQPSGVAIAPAKQRRVRTIVLRVGVIVGAGVALGSVIALTAGTPSKPPGAH